VLDIDSAQYGYPSGRRAPGDRCERVPEGWIVDLLAIRDLGILLLLALLYVLVLATLHATRRRSGR
jgi:hypothetical protein